VQEEQKAREKISDDKNLFYYLARSEQKDGQRFMCFIGKKNNQEYYLMIPDKLV
jgi:hypothetical protein